MEPVRVWVSVWAWESESESVLALLMEHHRIASG